MATVAAPNGSSTPKDVIEIVDDDESIDEEQLEDYEEELDQLGSFPDKVKINSLTMVAEDHASSRKSASALYNTIRKRLTSSDPQLLLPLVYVLDSILKNAKGHYVGTIENDASNWIPQVHRRLPDEAQRAKLQKVWRTWNEFNIFPLESWKLMGACFDARVDEKALTSSSDKVAGISRTRDGSLLLPSRLRQEMESVLDDLQSDMTNELDKVSLERLADKNPKLLGDIKQAAEDNLRLTGGISPMNSGGGNNAPTSTLLPFLTETRSAEAMALAKEWSDYQWDGPTQATDVAKALEDLVTNATTSSLYTQQEAMETTPFLAAAMATTNLLNTAVKHLNESKNSATTVSSSTATSNNTHSPNKASSSLRTTTNSSIDPSKFTNEGVKQKNPAIIGMLYEVGLPFVSSTDGRRFRTQLELSQHLDSLFKQKREEKSALLATDERGWYMLETVWTGEEAESTAMAASNTLQLEASQGGGGTNEYNPDSSRFPADETRDRCVVCGLNFKMVFNADEGAYDYTNCREIVVENDEMALEESEDMLVHVTCWRGLGSPEILTSDQTLQDHTRHM